MKGNTIDLERTILECLLEALFGKKEGPIARPDLLRRVRSSTRRRSLRPSSVHDQLHRLIEKGYVKQPGDARKPKRGWYFITPEGYEYLYKLRAIDEFRGTAKADEGNIGIFLLKDEVDSITYRVPSSTRMRLSEPEPVSLDLRRALYPYLKDPDQLIRFSRVLDKFLDFYVYLHWRSLTTEVLKLDDDFFVVRSAAAKDLSEKDLMERVASILHSPR